MIMSLTNWWKMVQKEVEKKKLWLIASHLLVVGLNRMSLGTNWHEYMMGLHLMHVKHWIGGFK